jgi:hypothetical protein
MSVCARGLLCELHGARVVIGKADTATRGRELRHGCRRYAPHRGVVLVWVERLDQKVRVTSLEIFLSCLGTQYSLVT